MISVPSIPNSAESRFKVIDAVKGIFSVKVTEEDIKKGYLPLKIFVDSDMKENQIKIFNGDQLIIFEILDDK